MDPPFIAEAEAHSTWAHNDHSPASFSPLPWNTVALEDPLWVPHATDKDSDPATIHGSGNALGLFFDRSPPRHRFAMRSEPSIKAPEAKPHLPFNRQHHTKITYDCALATDYTPVFRLPAILHPVLSRWRFGFLGVLALTSTLAYSMLLVLLAYVLISR
ncbi:hypothetical protein DL93DRAFT_2173859 [Clavulina sp. PMI_390]|nr:hypothetical protein DL93DRAFT_2173859 [Clavulina sp. PMI_390]